ncbi:hypothetical protein [Actinoplanes sichuanensis]|uniref:GNAT family N-acetyltransferase n=1 Tax=Actinoplanes sichuanensis TaxID=512349 RepID=A0ABW4AV58_9ACTN|nr:hypothetical protein [Actinoplanes sichuanensis]
MAIELITRFTVDDRQLSALHSRAFGADPAVVQPWSQRWLHVDFEPHLARFYLEGCGFQPTRAGLVRLT